jgi:serine/threonine protein kinase
LVTAAGVEVRVGRKLARGGQGEVFEVVGRSDVVSKRYYDRELTKAPDLAERLEVMVANRPTGWQEAGSRHVLLPWPTDMVFEAGRFVGYLMPRVDPSGSARLLRVTDPSDRPRATGDTAWLRGFTWRYLVATAANLALAVEALHSEDVVIGDFNDANVAVTREARVTLFDCDSMQITDPHSGRRFLCRVYRPEFLAPELGGLDLKVTYRPKSSDLFSLAVHIHQLLLEGEHPFRGRWTGRGEPPPEGELARQGLWTHAGNPDISPRRAAVGIDLLPPKITGLFRLAFVDGAQAPGQRPKAVEWKHALQELSQQLTNCKADKQHWYPASHSSCPWCTHNKARRPKAAPPIQTALPPSAAPFPATGPNPSQTTPTSFNLPPIPPATTGRVLQWPPSPIPSQPQRTPGGTTAAGPATTVPRASPSSVGGSRSTTRFNYSDESTGSKVLIFLIGWFISYCVVCVIWAIVRAIAHLSDRQTGAVVAFAITVMIIDAIVWAVIVFRD